MKVKPMIFNPDMALALHEDRKGQTRRPITFPVKFCENTGFSFMDKLKKWWACGIGFSQSATVANFVKSKSPWQVGDMIYVRETFRLFDSADECDHADFPCPCPRNGAPIYFANCRDSESKWTPSIHMPRRASRTTLKVTGVRVERVQDITEDDAVAEGFEYSGWRPTYSDPDSGGEYSTARDKFADTWISIYGDHWDNNGWCWVIDFEVIHQNVDVHIKKLEAA